MSLSDVAARWPHCVRINVARCELLLRVQFAPTPQPYVPPELSILCIIMWKSQPR